MKTSLVTAVILSTVLSGCLKSRLQVREDGDDKTAAEKPIPAQVQEVQTPGQYAIDEMKGEITRLTGRVEDLERAKQDPAVASAQKEEMRKLEQRIMELEKAQAQMIEAMKKQPEPPRPAADTREAFEKAKSLYDTANYDAAIEAFTAYLQNAKAAHAEEATFYRGESHFQLKQYKKAIVDFSRFPEKYPRSKRMPLALYRIGLSFDALGLKEDAHGFFQELVEKYPKSPEAKKARAKLR